LWEVNQKIGQPLSTATILTTDASPLMSAIHDRMPVILSREDYGHWLDPDADPEALLTLFRPYDDLALHPVSKRVNSPRNNDTSLIEPVKDVPPLTLFDTAPDALTRNPE
jgi:putative SOS response-associated peptidase YedK